MPNCDNYSFNVENIIVRGVFLMDILRVVLLALVVVVD